MDVRCAPVDMRTGCSQKKKQSLAELGKGGFQKACGAGTGGQFAEGSRKGCEGRARASKESGTLGGRKGKPNLLIGLLEKQPEAKLEAGSHTDFHREAERRNHHLWSACRGLNSSHEQRSSLTLQTRTQRSRDLN